MEIKRFIGGILEANGYVLSDPQTGTCWIVDPGYKPKVFIQYVKQQELQPLGILLTHHHSDHTGAADQVRRALDCPVYIHKADADRYGEWVDVLLEGGEGLTLGDERFSVQHTPGHTKGSVCFLFRKSRACFTGDTVFNVDLGRTDLEDGSFEEMCESILQVADHWAGDITIYPGHGDSCTMKTVRRINQEFIDIVAKAGR